MTFKIYVDGQSGTTGLQIHQRLAKYEQIQVLELPAEHRKDIAKKKAIINEADVVFLCLPDDAARETVSLIENSTTRVIDASTAHRTEKDWVYGLPELIPGQREKIRQATRVAVTGCHASAVILSILPLISQGVLADNATLGIHSITGYSGGGKGMIAEYQEMNPLLQSPRPYALGLAHKHIPEIQFYTGLKTKPVFVPVVGSFYQGLTTSIPLHSQNLLNNQSARDVHQVMVNYYQDEPFINVLPFDESSGTIDGFYDVQGCNLTNRVDIAVFGNEEQILLLTRLDNLGKGASGAAIQCMNIMLGFDENCQLATYL